MNTGELDNLLWTALTGVQAPFALGDGPAKRFRPDIGPLAAIADTSRASLEALSQLARETGILALMQAGPEISIPGLKVVRSAAGVQMTFMGDADSLTALSPALIDPRPQVLGPADFPDMLALAQLTEPGPFAARTGDLGQFWGIRTRQGKLIAMAGQRTQTLLHHEISAVCVHPDARGRGLAALLSRRVMMAMLEAGRTPILHSYANNTAALALYRRLGFVERSHVQLTAYMPDD